MLIILYNLSSAIINQTNKRRNGFIKFAIIQDFLVGIGIAIYLIYIIENFIIKNVSANNVLLRGIILDDKFYEFDNQNLLEPNNVCLVQITRNWWPSFANLLRQLLIRVDDIIGNKYTIACNLDPELIGHGVMVEAEDGKKFCGYNCKYHIENIALPTLVEE